MLEGKRIVFVLPSFELGGAERQALLLARHLAQKERAQVKIAGPAESGRVVELCKEYGLPWQKVVMAWPGGYIKRFKSLYHFAKALRKLEPDILLPYGFYPNLFCGLTWFITGAKLCVWNQRDEGLHIKGTYFERMATWLTPAFISNSQHGAEFLSRKFNIPPDKIKVIYNGVAIEPAISDRQAWRMQIQVGQHCFLACMVANLHKHKDHATLLKAWRIVVDRMPVDETPTLLLAGRFDNAHDAIKALAFDLDLNKSVRFLGPVDDIAGLLASVDLGVFSSHYEGCPNAVLEYMAKGLAVVATDIPGIREAVGYDYYPFLTPPGDANALADKIIYLLSNDEERQRLGSSNKNRITTVFNPEKIHQNTCEIINGWMKF